MVTAVPVAPEDGVRPVMLGVSKTVKLLPLLATPATVTTTLPVVAPVGTGTTMLVALQLVGVVLVPLNLTVLLPWLDPKPEPAIVTDAPTAAEDGERLVMLGVANKNGENAINNGMQAKKRKVLRCDKFTGFVLQLCGCAA